MPAKKNRYVQALRITGVSIVILLLLTLIFSNIIISTYLKRVLQKQTTESFSIETGDLSVNIFNGGIVAGHVTVKLSNKKMDLTAEFDNIYVNSFSILSYLKEKTYRSSLVTFNNGNIYYHNKGDTTVKVTDKPLPEVAIGRLIFNNVKIQYDDPDSNKLYTNGISILLNSVTLKQLNQPGFWTGKQLSYLNLKEFRYLVKDSLYTFRINHITLLPSRSLLVLDSVKVDPEKDEKKFFKKKVNQTDRFDVNVEKVVCNYEQIYNDKGELNLLVNYIFIKKPIMNVSRDRNFHREETIKPTVQQLIKENKFPLNIKKIVSEKGRVEYREYQVNDPKPIDVWFSNFSSEWRNLNTNDSTGNFEILANANLYDEGPVNLQLHFPLKPGSEYFTVTTQLKDIRLKRFNNAFAGKVNLKIKEGNIQSMQCNFIAGVDSSRGEMKFEYSDLKVETRDKTTKKSNTIKEKIKTFIANKILLNKNNNPETLSYVKLGAKRDKTRFVFNYIVKTLASGAIESVRKSKDQGPQKK